MKILVVGYPKTGTKSLNAALTFLGYQVYDYEHNFQYFEKQWIKIFTKGGTKEDFYQMFKDVEVSMDLPVCLFWEEMLEAFPDMKLIFTRRENEEIWLKSLLRQAKAIDDNFQFWSLAFFSPTAYRFVSYAHHLRRVAFSSIANSFYRPYTGTSPTVAKKRYRDHNSSVILRAPKDQTLEFNLTEGWAPLCKFLGKDIPDVPFPHKNKNATVMDDLLKSSPVFLKMKQEMKVVLSILVILVAGTIYCLLNWF